MHQVPVANKRVKKEKRTVLGGRDKTSEKNMNVLSIL